MAVKRKRVIGTTSEAIARTEVELGFPLPPSFRNWLLQNNGVGLEDIEMFPVFDERDPRKTWDSIVRQYDHGRWFFDFSTAKRLKADNLLPFAASGSGDCYCFDYSRVQADGEAPIVLWSHETGGLKNRANTFAAFVEKVQEGLISD